MTLAASLALASAATLAAGALLFVLARRARPAPADAWIFELARAIALSRLRGLPAEHVPRYREEYEADLLELRGEPGAALVHALQSAAATGRLRRMLDGPSPRRHAPLRRVLAHLGVPVRLDDVHRHADASYVFDGALRSRR